MSCPVCPCPACVAARQQFPSPYPYPYPYAPTPTPSFGMYQCSSCKGWYQIGSAHGCMTPLGNNPTMNLGNGAQPNKPNRF